MPFKLYIKTPFVVRLYPLCIQRESNVMYNSCKIYVKSWKIITKWAVV